VFLFDINATNTVLLISPEQIRDTG